MATLFAKKTKKNIVHLCMNRWLFLMSWAVLNGRVCGFKLCFFIHWRILLFFLNFRKSAHFSNKFTLFKRKSMWRGCDCNGLIYVHSINPALTFLSGCKLSINHDTVHSGHRHLASTGPIGAQHSYTAVPNHALLSGSLKGNIVRKAKLFVYGISFLWFRLSKDHRPVHVVQGALLQIVCLSLFLPFHEEQSSTSMKKFKFICP